MKDEEENNQQLLQDYINWGNKWCFNTKYIICKGTRTAKSTLTFLRVMRRKKWKIKN